MLKSIYKIIPALLVAGSTVYITVVSIDGYTAHRGSGRNDNVLHIDKAGCDLDPRTDNCPPERT